MTKEEKQIEILMFLGICKLCSEQSTYLIGELTKDKKQRFNIMVSSVDNFINAIEKDLSPDNRTTMELMREALNDGMHNFRKDLLNTK